MPPGVAAMNFRMSNESRRTLKSTGLILGIALIVVIVLYLCGRLPTTS